LNPYQRHLWQKFWKHFALLSSIILFRRDFANHAVIKYSGKYYDPYYGKPSSGSGYSTQLAWGDDALDLLYYGDDPDPYLGYAVQDPKGTQETKFDP
jgi:hypothetical protein